jgi:putative FmdB family regulatory protein
MPTYEYECSACGEKFEVFQSISAKPLKKCSQCGKSAAKRLISAGAGVIFKGSGFYETDYRSDSYKAAAKSESSSSDTSKPAENAKASPAASHDKAAKSSDSAPSAEAKSAPVPKKSPKNK